MPGFDGTGPSGMGPMTGGGRGFCTVPAAGIRPRPFGRRSFGRGGGRGCGRGWRHWCFMRDFPVREEGDMPKEEKK